MSLAMTLCFPSPQAKMPFHLPLEGIDCLCVSPRWGGGPILNVEGAYPFPCYTLVIYLRLKAVDVAAMFSNVKTYRIKYRKHYGFIGGTHRVLKKFRAALWA